MLTTKQAAERIGISVRRVLALLYTGQLTGEKPGRDWMVDEASVEAYAARVRRPGRPSAAVGP